MTDKGKPNYCEYPCTVRTLLKYAHMKQHAEEKPLLECQDNEMTCCVLGKMSDKNAHNVGMARIVRGTLKGILQKCVALYGQARDRVWLRTSLVLADSFRLTQYACLYVYLSGNTSIF
jgi:hypothetical protein